MAKEIMVHQYIPLDNIPEAQPSLIYLFTRREHYNKPSLALPHSVQANVIYILIYCKYLACCVFDTIYAYLVRRITLPKRAITAFFIASIGQHKTSGTNFPSRRRMVIALYNV